jgi:hypothetical protein
VIQCEGSEELHEMLSVAQSEAGANGGPYLIDGLGLADTGEVIEEFRGDAGIGYRVTVGIVGGVTVVDGQATAEVFHFPWVAVCCEQVLHDAVDSAGGDGSGVCCEVCDDSGHIEWDIVSAASDTFADGVGVWVVGGDLVIVEQSLSEQSGIRWFQSADFYDGHVIDGFAGQLLLSQFAEDVVESDGSGEDHPQACVFLSGGAECIEQQESIGGGA